MKIEQLINPELKIPIYKNSVKLLESRNKDKNTLQEIEIQGLPENIFIFSLDKDISQYCHLYEQSKCNGVTIKVRNQFLNPWQQEDDKKIKRINKVCDAIMINYLQNNKLEVVFIEMKTDLPQTSEKYKYQLLNGKLFIEYILSLFNDFIMGDAPDEKVTIEKTHFFLFYLDTYSKFVAKKGEIGNSSDEERPLLLMQKGIRTEMRKGKKENLLIHPLPKPMYNYLSYNELIKGNIHYS